MGHIIIYRPTEAERKAANAVREVRRFVTNSAVSMVHQQLYGQQMVAFPPLSNEELLLLDDDSRNKLVLQSEDGSTEMIFLDSMMDVTQSFTIVETALTGRKGSVKEYIQAQDYVITLTGSLSVNAPLAFPITALRELNELFNAPQTYKVANVMLNEGYGIDKVVVTKAEFKQSENYKLNVLPYTIELKSDEDYDFEVQ